MNATVVSNDRSTVDYARVRDAFLRVNTAFTVSVDSGELHVNTPADMTGGGYVPPCQLSHLGAPAFCTDYGIRLPCVSGSMANGIASVEIVEAMSRHGMLGFFGAAGLSLDRVEAAIDRLQTALGDGPYGFNLIHSPNEMDLEAGVVDLYIRRGVKLVEASAFLGLTLPVVRYRVHGIHQAPDGSIVAPNRIIAKVSRIEVARHFLSPPPDKLLAELVARGEITTAQADWARQIPMAQDITVEADSGGHTDNRPALTLLPLILDLRDRLQHDHNYPCPLRVGLAGGIATPRSAAAAFSMAADYIVTGSINQCTTEAGTSDAVREMLAQTEQADVIMAPAADMFEMGVKVQVLKRGTMFAMRGAKLYELYRGYDSLDALPKADKDFLEKSIFRDSLSRVWASTTDYFRQRDPSQIERANRDPKHKMALVFRAYLGQTSRWANRGVADRKIDYQIWCGPSMGAFNQWVNGTFLEDPANRDVATIAMNLVFLAAVQSRATCLRQQGIPIPPEAIPTAPLRRDEIEAYIV